MSETFTNKLTIKGQHKKALAETNNRSLNITTFQVGDGNGAYYEPTESQTALKNTKYTGTFIAGTQSQIIANSSATNEVLYKCFIPADVGGFTIRELGLFDKEGDLILICKLPAQDKFALASGLYQPLTFTPKIIYTNPTTSAVLTPTSQIVPTTSEVITMISEYAPKTEFSKPLINNGDTISLEMDDSLTVLENKLSVATIPYSKGGTGLTEIALGQLIYGASENAFEALAGNIMATKKFLTQTGTGLASAAPVWETFAASDLPVSGVAAGSYTNANLTVDAYGRVTSISSAIDTIIALGTVSSGTITLAADKFHTVIFSGASTIALPSGLTSGVRTNCTLLATMSSVVTITQPSNVTWVNAMAPSMTSTTAKYRLTYETIDGGTTWYGYCTTLGN